MAENKSILYAAFVTCIGFICLALASTVVGLPVWAYYGNPTGGYDSDRGYFGPWRVCKQLTIYREICGSDVSRFRPSLAVYVSGIVASASCACLGLFCILCIMQLAMKSCCDKGGMKCLVLFKLVWAMFAVILAVLAAGLFAVQTNDERNSIKVTWGLSFYLQIVVIILTIILLILAAYDYFIEVTYRRRPNAEFNVGATAAKTYVYPEYQEQEAQFASEILVL